VRTKLCFAVLFGVFLALLGRSVGIAQPRQAAQDVQAALGENTPPQALPQAEIARIFRGFEIAPVPLNLEGKIGSSWGSEATSSTRKAGAMTATPLRRTPRAAIHFSESRRSAARYLAGGTPFGDPTDPNTPVSRNLTPRASTGLPAGLTWEQFRVVMRTGADLKHRPPFVPSADQDLLQVMPWPVYQDMIDRDLRAIYEYLRTIPSLPSAP
jgi:hypothetical protein